MRGESKFTLCFPISQAQCYLYTHTHTHTHTRLCMWFLEDFCYLLVTKSSVIVLSVISPYYLQVINEI